MSTINKIAKVSIISGLLMGAVAAKATNPITNVNKTPNQTEVVSKEGAAALRAASLQGVQQASVMHNQRLDYTFRKFGKNAEETKQINTIINDVYNNYGTFLASVQIQHELDRQQLYLLLKQDTKTLSKINPTLAKEVSEIGPEFYNGVRNNNAARVEKWLNEEYTPSLLGLLSFNHKPTGEEMIKKLDELAEKKAGFSVNDLIDYHTDCDNFRDKALKGKKDNLSMSELVAYKMFAIDKIIIKKTLTNNNFFGENSHFRKYSGLSVYYNDWMNSVAPKGK